MSELDLVLDGGWVADGTGAPPLRADVGVSGDRIGVVGDLRDAATASRVDCRGLLVFPGFIDTHAHAERMFLGDGAARDTALAMLAQGVTSCILGQDGLSFAPASAATLEYVVEYFGTVNGPSPFSAADTAGGISVADLLLRFERTSSVNVGFLVPHGNLRLEAAGLAARPVTPDELARMQALLDDGMAAGALGVSTGLEYLPARHADIDELAAVARASAAAGGLYVTHMRGYETAAPMGMAEVRAIGMASGSAVHVSHYHGPANMLIGLVDDMRADGVDVTFDNYPYVVGQTILAMVALPTWVQDGGTAATAERLRDPMVRKTLAEQWFPGVAGLLAETTIAFADADSARWCEGLTLPEAASRAGADGVGDFVCDLLADTALRVGCVFRHPPTNTEADVRALLRHPAQMAGSDGIYLGGHPHPRAYGTFARLLGRHTRELGDWTWGEASLHLSGHPARRFGLADRGLVRPGFVADLAVIDPEAVRDEATFAEPRRPAVGVRRVYVSGVEAYADGALTGATPGRALRRGR